eukprot:2943641-Prymnesium_polylepis.1
MPASSGSPCCPLSTDERMEVWCHPEPPTLCPKTAPSFSLSVRVQSPKSRGVIASTEHTSRYWPMADDDIY